jgi:hypothetical protein
MNKGNVQFITKKSEQLRRILEELQTKHHDLQTYFDIASDKWQQSVKGEQMAENLSALEDASNELEAALTSLETIAEYE